MDLQEISLQLQAGKAKVVKELVQQAKALDSSIYTPASWMAVSVMIQNAELLINNPDTPKAVIDNAWITLNMLKNRLVTLI